MQNIETTAYRLNLFFIKLKISSFISKAEQNQLKPIFFFLYKAVN